VPSVIRGVPILALDGTRSIECESQYTLVYLLRRLDSANLDAGAVSLAAYDTANLNHGGGSGPQPNGTGYRCSLRETPGAAATLVVATVAQNGVRAERQLSFTGAPLEGETVTITYPDLSDTSVAPPTITRLYTYRAVPAQAGDLLIGSAAVSAATLLRAINGTSDYGDPAVYHGTEPCRELIAVAGTAGGDIHLEARDGGVWGNNVGIAETLSNGAWSGGATTLDGGTGTRGLTLSIAYSLLSNDLVLSGVSRAVHYDIMGMDTAGAPTKLIAGPATLYASSTETA